MVELDQFKAILNSYAKPLVEVRDSLDLANKEKRIEELERKMEEPDFWTDQQKSSKVLKHTKVLKTKIENFENLKNRLSDAYFYPCAVGYDRLLSGLRGDGRPVLLGGRAGAEGKNRRTVSLC